MSWIMDYQDLERLAEQWRAGNSDSVEKNFGVLGHELKHFQMSLGVSIRDRVKYLKQKFSNEPIFVADLGGGNGGLAGEINDYDGVEAFCIDEYLRIPHNGKLPRNRFIKANVENMPEIPNETFHYLISYNAIMSYTDISKSIPEAYRILKPEGIADFDWEFPDEEQLVTLQRMPFFKYIKISSGLMPMVHIKKPL